MPDLFDPFKLGTWELPHRIVLAPLTRNRAGRGQVPQERAVRYYGQRAGAALIISEGTQPSAVGQGYLDTPGMYSPEQMEGWRHVANAVHEGGGRIVVQLMHAGRIAHPDNKDGLETVAPSAIAAPNEMFTPEGMKPFPVPRALTTQEIPGLIHEFVHAAESAIKAGLDGVELHAANGYLLHQFLSPASNQRDDQYGGSPVNRAQLTIEIARAVADAIGADRVGIRISPAHNIQGALETDPADVAATYGALIDGIAPLGMAYVSVLADPSTDLVKDLRSRFGRPWIINTGFGSLTTRDQAQALLDQDLGDLIAVGRLFLANPDLPARWKLGTALNEPDADTFYGGDEHGYTDYPFLDQSA